MESVHLQLPAELLARVDKAAGDIPRNRWIRRAIERALDAQPEFVPPSTHNALVEAARKGSPAPAERPCEHRWEHGATLDMNPPIDFRTCRKCGRSESRQDAPFSDGKWHVTRRPYRQQTPGPNVENVRSSSQAKRDVRPIPKGGK